MAKSNKCEMGFCSRGYTSDEVSACQLRLGSDWNGLCAYQDGQFLKDNDESAKLDCCSRGCTMPRGQYARWNGLCAYMGQFDDESEI